MIEIENLTKTFGTQTVISDISMTLVSGKIYGLVGRNGSGKTVLMKMILGFIKPTSGTIKVNGKQVGKDIAQVGRIADQRGGKKVVTGNSKKHRQKHITDRRGQIGVHLPFINGCHRFSPPLLLIHFRSAAVPAHLQEHPVPSAA